MRRMSQRDAAHPISEASEYLRDLARRIAAAYIAHMSARGAVLVGSASTGECDEYSDIDLGLQYDALPTDEQLDAARAQVIRDLGAQPFSRPVDGDWYRINGVECQVGLATLDALHRHLDRGLGPDFLEGDQRALSGWLHVVPLYGDELVERYRARVATYPEELARATVRRYLRFHPIWYLRSPDYFAARDAALWFHQAATVGCLHVLGVLAGINHQYYSTFQFKRMRAFTETLNLKPADLPDRIERVLANLSREPAAAASELEALVAETVALVEQHLPEIDVTQAKRRLGERHVPWRLPRSSRDLPEWRAATRNEF